MSNCKNCNCHCHCNKQGHEDVYGPCTCNKCECNSEAESVLENEGGLIIDETGECDSCQ